MTSAALIIARKEIVDHLRDRRSLASTIAYALMGPAIVMLVSFSPKGQGESMLVVMLGMMSVFALVSTFIGSMNIAMDVMSGERERRSLVPLLMTPVTRRDVVIGKWTAASAFGLGALTLNIAGLVIVLASRAPAVLATHAGTARILGDSRARSARALGASLEILVASLSRTMKEAGTSLTLVVFTPMIAGMFLVFFPVPGGWWSVVPIVGQQMIIEAGIRGAPASLLQVVVLAAVTTSSASAPLAAAERVLSRDDVAV